VPFKDAYEHTLNYATTDLDYQKYLHDKYPQIAADDPKVTLALRVKQDMTDRGDDKGFYDKPKTREVEGYKPQDPVRPSYLELWNMQHNNGDPNPPSKSQTNTPLYRQAQVEGLVNNDKDAWTLLDAKIKANPEYNQQGLTLKPFIVHHNGHSLLKVDVPDRLNLSKPDGKGGYEVKVPAHSVFIDVTDKKAGAVSANELINKSTGENVDMQTLETPGGKKHIGGAQQKIPYQNVTKAKDSKGKVVSLGYHNGKWYNVDTNQPVE
jgi:hypothetical protein